jgi:hypothetical protein
MSIAASTIARATERAMAAPTRTLDLDAAPTGAGTDPTDASLAEVSCWRLLTARVPLTLLLDLAMPTRESLEELADELLAEPCSLDWLVRDRSGA